MDEHDLELVAHLRPEPIPDQDTVTRHHRQLEAAIDAAAMASTAPAVDDVDDVDGETGLHVIPLTRRQAGTGRGRSWRRAAVTCAAAVAAGGLFAAAQLAVDDDQTVTSAEGPGSSDGVTEPGPPEQAPCGTTLPITFTAPAGYEGPFPGRSGSVPTEPDLSPDTFLVHWRAASGTIDVRWPSFPPLDPTTPHESTHTEVFEDQPEPTEDGSTSQRATFYSRALGAGQCVGLDAIVTSGDTRTTERTLDQVESALVGPGGALAGPERPLVTEWTTADVLPEPVPCAGPESEATERIGGPVEDPGTYPTPTDALAFFLATEPFLAEWDYQEMALPDGSFGYAHREDLTGAPGEVVTVVHVVRSGEGWAVASWQATGC